MTISGGFSRAKMSNCYRVARLRGEQFYTCVVDCTATCVNEIIIIIIAFKGAIRDF